MDFIVSLEADWPCSIYVPSPAAFGFMAGILLRLKAQKHMVRVLKWLSTENCLA